MGVKEEKMKESTLSEGERQAFLKQVRGKRYGARNLLENAPPAVRADNECVLAAINEEGSALEHAHEDLKRDQEVVLAAVHQDGSAYKHAHEDLKKDKEMVMAV